MSTPEPRSSADDPSDIAVIDQWLAATSVTELQQLKISREQLLAARTELAKAIERKALWTSLGLLLLHLPALYLALEYGDSAAFWKVGLFLAVVHLAVVAAAIRPEIIEFEMPPRAYSKGRLAIGCVVVAALMSFFIASIAPADARWLVFAVSSATFTGITYGLAGPVLVFSWLGRSIGALRELRRTRRPSLEFGLDELTSRPLKRPASANSVTTEPPAWSRSFGAQVLGFTLAGIAFYAFALAWYAATGMKLPDPLYRGYRSYQAPAAPAPGSAPQPYSHRPPVAVPPRD